jgi:ankyrin repeat protein
MNTPKFSIVGCTLVLLLALSLPAIVSAQQFDEEIITTVKSSNVAELAQWLANDGDINATTKEGNTLLMLATKIGDRPTVEFLLAQSPNIDAQNTAGATALMIAAKYGHNHVVSMLLEVGADPTIRNNSGITAARFALAYNHTEVLDQLREAEAVLRARSS